MVRSFDVSSGADMAALSKLIDGKMDDVKRATVRGLLDAAQDVITEALARTPLEGGELRASARVELDLDDGDEVTVWLIYDAEHALYQHEGQRSDGSHRVRVYTTPGTGAEFLLSAAEDEVNTWTEGLIRRVRQHL